LLDHRISKQISEIPTSQAVLPTIKLSYEMKKLLSKVKTTIQDRSLPHPDQDASHNPSPPLIRDSTITPPTSADVFRYRYHHGSNLGSIFCLEQWLSPTLYPPGATGTELSAVKASIDLHGVFHTTQKWSSHWGNALSESDLGWLANTAHCTSIRLPIGYYCLGKDFCLGTPFESVKEVYAGAWGAVKSLVERAKQWGIGVLLDLHALPGGANSEYVFFALNSLFMSDSDTSSCIPLL